MSYETPVPEDESTGTGDEIRTELDGVGPGVAGGMEGDPDLTGNAGTMGEDALTGDAGLVEEDPDIEMPTGDV